MSDCFVYFIYFDNINEMKDINRGSLKFDHAIF